MHERYTRSEKNGRSVSIHPNELLLEELSERQRTPQGRAKLLERVGVEHSLAHIGHWQGHRSRYIGTPKILFDLRRSAVVHNLHVIARMPDEQEREEAIAALLLDRLSKYKQINLEGCKLVGRGGAHETHRDPHPRAGAKTSCERRTIRVDLSQETWLKALLAAGYQPERPSVWLIEGLLFYLPRAAVHGLLEKVGALTVTGSLLGLDVMNRGLFFSPVAWPMQAALARLGAPGQFGTNDPETLMARHGWEADATQPGEGGANFGRWPRPMLPRRVPSVPRSFLVKARRS